MLFSYGFEIGALVLGLLYIGHLYFKDVIELIEISKDIENEEHEKQEDEKLKKMTKYIYS